MKKRMTRRRTALLLGVLMLLAAASAAFGLPLPTKIGTLWTAVTGGERADDSPVSIVGASRLGGEAVERGYWDLFIGLLLSINFFLGAFNLVPLLPLDGGHVVVALWDGLRRAWAKLWRRPPPAPVDATKLVPVTFVVVVALIAMTVVLVGADLFNPVKLLGG